MKPAAEKLAIARKLQAQINSMQGLCKLSPEADDNCLAPFSAAFPGSTFPNGAIHEFVSYEIADAAATTGFISGIISKLSKEGGLCLWVAGGEKIYPAGLKHFGLEPDRIVFIHTTRPKEALWIIEEALKCEALNAVIGEIRELSFSDSRRLQLAVERSGVTGFIHRYRPNVENAVACTTRWKITSLPSVVQDNLPGVGYSAWNVQLVKVRNGRPHAWQVSWQDNRFTVIEEQPFVISLNERHTG